MNQILQGLSYYCICLIPSVLCLVSRTPLSCFSAACILFSRNLRSYVGREPFTYHWLCFGDAFSAHPTWILRKSVDYVDFELDILRKYHDFNIYFNNFNIFHDILSIFHDITMKVHDMLDRRLGLHRDGPV